MTSFLSDYYLWIKALHVMSVIAWMAALLYLPRLFVYHVDAPAGSQQSETFKVMERRLMRGIMNPSMIATWIFGLAMLGSGAVPGGAWLHAKLALVVVLTGVHHMIGRWRKAFLVDANKRSARFYRMMNEVPAVIMVGVVILVIVKPF